jgi:triacylglycerol lipase
LRAAEIAALRALGDDPSEDAVAAAGRVFAGRQEREPYPGLRVTRDLAYGEHPRQQLDVFAEEGLDRARGVLVFAHGGGYVSGDKRLRGTPYYDNVGVWAVRHGLAGVTMNYRFAPEAVWPDGADDVASVVAWVREHVAAHGGDPARIFLMGHSAGAAHIASYIARTPAPPVAGAILASGVYDLVAMEWSERHRAYFGDPAAYAERSSVEGVARSRVPLLIVAAELEPQKFHPQAERLARAVLEHRGRLAPALCLPDHTHFSPIFALGAGPGALDDLLATFLGGEVAR